MLRKIPVSQLRVGMHLHAFEGAWIDHPFWRKRFVISSTDELDAVQRSGVAECWIDPRLGRDVDSVQLAPAMPFAPPAGVAPPEPAAPSAPPSGARDFASELKEAAAICRRGRDAVASMFAEVRMGRAVDAAGCLALVEEVSRSVERNAGALVSLARLKTRDDYTYMHSVAVCALMVARRASSARTSRPAARRGSPGSCTTWARPSCPSRCCRSPAA